MEIISRADARERGLKRYYTGKPCKHGHDAERTVHNRHCVECHREESLKYHEENREARLEYARKYREENREARREARHKYREENREACLEYARKYHEENREARLEYARKYAAANPDKRRAISATRRAHKRKATTPDAIPEAIAAIYADVKGIEELLGVPCHVDHYIPLAAGGLHHQDNLQIITATANASKGAKVPGVDWHPPTPAFEQVSVITRINP